MHIMHELAKFARLKKLVLDIAKNLSKLSKKKKLELLKQESPELFELVRDFREKVLLLVLLY